MGGQHHRPIDEGWTGGEKGGEGGGMRGEGHDECEGRPLRR